jgi:TolB-like protein/Flp pilus assembly protein TadD
MSLIAELKRRNVFRVGAAYAIVAWLLVEVASVVLPALHLPDWTLTFLIIVILAGLPLALIIAWAFELTPEGIKRETVVDPAESITRVTGRKLDFAIIGLLAIAVVYFALDKFVLDAGREDPEASAEQVPAAESVAGEKTIAVLPFANMSGDPEQEFFSDGISEELLNVLAKVKGLRVTSRTSAFAFKGTNTAVPEIAEKLGVEHVLEGSVRMAGDRVRITAQLIEVETDSHLWSESYDRDLADIFAVQDEIAAKVGEALKVALLGADSKPIHPSREISIEAYSDYLLARQKLANMSYVGAGEAELLLQGVIERDPDYAPAYAALAGTYQVMAGWGASSPSEAVARMRPLIEQALSLDDGLAEAWQDLAYTREVQGDLEGAHMAEERALELEPQNPVVLINQIIRWLWSHEPERGLVYAEELLRVDPLSLQGLRFIASLYRRLDRRDDAERMFERMRSIDPKNTWYLWGGFYLANGHGDLVEALEFAEEGASIDIADPEGPSGIAMLYLELGDFAAAKFWIDAALRLDSEAPHARAMAALLHLYRDEEAEAVAIARELTQPGSRSRTVSRAIALRIEAGPDLAAGNYEKIITRNLTHYPELADGRLPAWWRSIEPHQLFVAFVVSLDLASVYLHAGEEAKAGALLSLVESELSHWPRTALWRYGVADAELHALRGEKGKALAALQEHADTGMRDKWRWQLLYNPNLESIRDTTEFTAIVAEIEADMAEQLARVHEMQRNGELTAIPELAAK